MTALFRAALVAGLAVAWVPSVAVAQNAAIDSLRHRVDSLERRTAELERQVNALEAQMGAQPSGSQPVPTSAGSPALANWRRLNRGMTADQVRQLLGEPTSVTAGASLTTWRYPEMASVSFVSGKVNGWSEPHE